MGRGREKEKAGKKRKSRHRHDDTESEETETSDSGSEESDSDTTDSETESSSTSEEERERRKRRREKEKKRRKSSDTSSSRTKHKSKQKKRRHSSSKSSSKAKRKKIKDTISTDDYFRKSVEFRMWLSEEKGIFFSDLSSSDSRDHFKKFVKKWNDGNLPKKYYRDVQSSALGHEKQTSHVWAFSKSLDNQKELAGLKHSVSEWTTSGAKESTESTGGGASLIGGGASMIGPQRPTASDISKTARVPLIGPTLAPGGPSQARRDRHLEEEGRMEERERERRERREMRKQQEVVLDELLPRATGREARLEKKKLRAEKRRNREISPDVAESTLMGPKTNIQEKIRHREVQRHSRAQAAAERVAEIQAREKSKMQALLQMAKASKKEGSLW